MRVLGPLTGVAALRLEDETPLFAADRDFAWDHGGPITRRFVEGLPADRALPVVVDSSLVWLAPGLGHGFELGGGGHPRAPLRFTHEPFPDVVTGVRGASNRNRSALHRMCVLGVDCTPELASGEVLFADAETAAAFWLPEDGFAFRDAEIARRCDEGSLVREAIPLGVVIEFGWGALMRPRPSAVTGFQFILRATIGDPRPQVNGRRNHSIV